MMDMSRSAQGADFKETIEEAFPKISLQLADNIAFFQKTFHSYDMVYRKFTIGRYATDAFFVGIDGLFDKMAIRQHVVQPLMSPGNGQTELNEVITAYVERHCVSLVDLDTSASMSTLVFHMMKGTPLLFVDGINIGYILGTSAYELRSIDEPVTETVVRGPREGFVESLQVNITMLRRKIAHPRLVVEKVIVGTVSRTDVALVYVDQIAEPSVIEEVRKRVTRIQIDSILESGYIEELIEDAPLSPFPTISNTQRPDVIAAGLLQGRIAILTDGTPEVLMVPYLFFESFQVSEDYYSRFVFSSFLRILRFVFFLVSTISPGLYVASLEYHYEIVPTDLLISIAAAREKVPFSAFVEMTLMLITFEVIREAGVRMPRPIGQALSIVGALIIGQTAVEAGFVSAPTIIIAALAGIASFLVVPLSDVGTLLKFAYLICGASFGMFGLMLLFCIIMLHVASLRSFGVPYMSPYFPSEFVGWRDFLLRFPRWMLDKVPSYMPSRKRNRQVPNQMPQPPENEG